MDGIIINGQKVVIPGVTSLINASALAGRGAASRGYVSYLYEAERGGEPKVPYILTNPAAVRRTLPARLATIVNKMAFAPSLDTDRIPTGAAAVILVRVNPAERAVLQLVDANAVAAVDVKAADWGNYGNDIAVTVAAGTTAGKKLTVTLGSLTETFDNVGDMDAFKLLFTPGSLPAGVSLTSMLGFVNPLATGTAPAVYVNGKIRIAGGTAAFDPRAWMAFDGNQGDASGRLKFTVTDQGSAKEIVVVGTRKDTGAAVTDTIAVADDQVTAYSTYTFSEISSIDVSDIAGDVDMEFSAFNLTASSYATLNAVVDRVTSKGRGFSATFETTKKNLPVTDLDYDLGSGGTGNDLLSPGHIFTADLYHLIANVSSTIVTLTRATSARNIVANQGPSNLTGGANNIASTGAGGDWDDGLTALKAITTSHVCARTGEKAVHGLINTHIQYMCGAGRNERIAFLGCPAGTGKTTADTGLYARTAALNSRNVALCCQETQIYDENGEAIFVEPYDTALLAAACDAGRNTTDSITWAVVDVLAFRDQPNHSTSPWSTRDDMAELIEHGLLLLGQREGTTLIQWVRDNPTYQTDDNPIFCSIFANEGLNTSNKNLRRKLETRIGRGSTVVTANSVRSWALAELRRQKKDLEIKDYDPRSVQVEDLGNGFVVDYRVAPAEAIYFIQATAFVQRMPTNA